MTEAAGQPPRARRAATSTMVGIVAGIMVLFLSVLVVRTVARVRAGRELDAAARTAQTTPPQVGVFRPDPSPAAVFTLAATTQPIQDAIVYARTSGYLSKRYVDIGHRVQTGQLLAEIASPEVDQQLSQARADLNQSQKTLELQRANLDLARTTMARYQAADAETAVAKEAVDQSVTGARTAQAAVAAAEASVASYLANVRRLEQLVSFERVVAPFSGVVIQRSVDVGALISAGSPTNNTAVSPLVTTGAAYGLFEIGRVDELRVFVSVPQAFASSITKGLRARIIVRGYLMQPVTGMVTRTASAIDQATRTLLTEIDIPNRSNELFPGMFVDVEFSVPPSGRRWRLPATAILIDTQGTRVMIVGADKKLHFQPVVLGRDFGATIDVQAGLNGTEVIVKQPTVSLREGQVVRTVDARQQAGQ